MDEDSQASSQPAEDAEMAERSGISLNKKASNSIQDLIDTFFTKADELRIQCQGLNSAQSSARMALLAVEDHLKITDLDVNIPGVDDTSALDDLDRIITLEIESSKRMSDFFAQHRIIIASLDELLALGAKIMDDHASEFENIHHEIKNKLIFGQESLTPAYVQRSFSTLLINTHIVLQLRQRNMNDHAREDNVSVDGRDAHQDEPLGKAQLNAKAIQERTKELETKRDILYQEAAKIDAEGRHHYHEWSKYNRRYLRLQKRMGSTANPLVLDIDDTAQLQKVSDLLTLDTQRAHAQLAMVQVRQRLREILAELKEMYMEFGMLMGDHETSLYGKVMQWFAEEEKRHHRLRRKLGEDMLKSAGIGQD
ncbi:hypothetical protein KCU65_g9522, partial [Aureobasidium melanogenum]